MPSRPLFIALLFLLTGCDQVGTGGPRIEQPRTSISPQPDASTGMVTLAWWNIEWFPAGPKVDPSATAISNHVAAVAKVLDRENPTILLACEVRDIDAVLMLNRILERPYGYVAVTDTDSDNRQPENHKNRQEIAIFSRIPWQDVWEVDFGSLPDAPDRPARGFIGAAFQIGGRPVTIYRGHWKSNYIRCGETQPELTALRNVEKRG